MKLNSQQRWESSTQSRDWSGTREGFRDKQETPEDPAVPHQDEPEHGEDHCGEPPRSSHRPGPLLGNRDRTLSSPAFLLSRNLPTKPGSHTIHKKHTYL